MRCASCGTENRPDRKFCSACGQRLLVACPECATANLPGERFCGECGTALSAPDPPAPAGAAQTANDRPVATSPIAERRLVSVLFADLVGFTTLAEERDPEAVREVLSEYFAAGRQVVERYAGTVEKFIGDAVMAVWGTPAAHEDDAERAVRAALELIDTVQELGRRVGVEALSARAAVVTGEAAVTIGARGEGMVAGDLVNTAARLQAAAEPGTVLVGEATEQATRDAIAFERVGDQTLRGKLLPVAAWRAAHVVAGRRGAGRTDVVEAPFVGRAAELRALKDALEATGAEGRARFLGVVGQGGIGKSRLAWELEKYADGLAAIVHWHRGRSPSYGEGVAYWALAEMVRERCRIAETDDAAVTGERLAAALAEYVDDVEERRWMEPHLRTLLGLEAATSGERDDQFAAWRRFFEAVARRGTAVLVFEDLQWADDGLLDFIDSLFEWSRNHPLLVVALARPELIERRPALGSTSRNALRLHLEPLSDSEVRRLLEGVAPDLPEDVLATVVQRAEGIPLFAIEMVRMLRDRPEGTATAPGAIRIPPSLQALVAARLDALAPDDRGLLQNAAVLGQTFTTDALCATSGVERQRLERQLMSLVRREFLVLDTDPRSPERGQFGFVQGVVRDVAYGTLGRRDRRTRHLAAARYFESLGDDEVAPVLAAHYLEAYRAAPDDEQAAAIRAQARLALRASADRAAALHNYGQAVRDLERASELTDEGREQAAILERQATLLDASGDYEAAARAASHARDAYEAHDDRTGWGRATAALGSIELKWGHHVEARHHLEAAVASLDPAEDAAVYARVAAQIARTNMFDGRYRECVEWTDRALAAAGPGRVVEVVAEALNTRGVALQWLGRLDESIALVEASMRLASAHHLVEAELRARFNLGGRQLVEDPLASMATVRVAIDLAHRTGRRDWHGHLSMFLLQTLTSTGRWDQAEAVMDALDVDELSSTDRAEVLLARAFIAAARGDRTTWAAARAEAERLVAGDTSRLRIEEWLARDMDVALFEGRFEDALRLARTVDRERPNYARVVAARAGARSGDASHLRGFVEQTQVIQGRLPDSARSSMRAALAAVEGRPGDAAAGFREAARALRDLDVPLVLADTLLDAVYALGTSVPDVDAFADEAREIYSSLGARAHLDRLAEARGAGSPRPRPTADVPSFVSGG